MTIQQFEQKHAIPRLRVSQMLHALRAKEMMHAFYDDIYSIVGLKRLASTAKKDRNQKFVVDNEALLLLWVTEYPCMMYLLKQKVPLYDHVLHITKKTNASMKEIWDISEMLLLHTIQKTTPTHENA